MLKRSIFAASAALLLILSACSGKDSKDSIRQLSDYKNVTAADSLIYYFGQLRAADYWQYAYSDTMMRSRESRDAYLSGLRAGLDAANNNDAYNQGLYVGVQLAMNMKEFKDEFDIDFNRRILINAVADGLKNDSVINAGEANEQFRNILNQFEARKEAADREKGLTALAELGREKHWVKINDEIYSGEVNGGNGTLITVGTRISADVAISTLDGRDIDRRSDDAMDVGSRMPGPITVGLLSMQIGQTKVFYTTAAAILGRYAARYNVDPTSIIKFTITTNPPKGDEAVDSDNAG